MLMVNLDDKKQGIALVDGVLYRVTGKYGVSVVRTYPDTTERRKVTLELMLNDTLDEEAQKKRITKLEYELQNERDRLEEIRRTVTGEESPED